MVVVRPGLAPKTNHAPPPRQDQDHVAPWQR